MRIDLNADLGEGIGDDEALLAIVTSANIATGAHAGGGAVLRRAVAAAAHHGVAIGAHPSYRDRAGFGRASHLDVLRSDPSARSHLVADLVEQVLQVARAAEGHGAALAHVKAHGSLYNEAVADPVAALVVAEAVLGAQHELGYRLGVLTQPGGQLAGTAADHGLEVIAEGFADRGYQTTGQLVPRTEQGALHVETSAMVAQALALAEGHVDTVEGPRIALRVDSLCVHGDTPGAVLAARAIRAALESSGWQVVAPGTGAGAAPVAVADRVADAGGDAGGSVDVVRSSSLRQSGAAATVNRPDPGTFVGAGPALVVHPFGDRALLVEAAGEPGPRPQQGAGWVLPLAGRVRRQWPTASIVPGLASLLIVFANPSDRPEVLGQTALPPPDPDVGPDDPGRDEPGPRIHVIRTRYDGSDLVEVAAMLRVPTVEVVTRHGASAWTVAAIGFSPGFAYLTTDDPLFAGVQRRADPRPRVPRGSVALAAGMCAVYPSATPGGWQLIGSAAAELFDVNAEHPSLLRVGDRVQFIEMP